MDNKHLPGDPGDKDKNLKEENELLKLKLRAEHGANFFETSDDLPPEVENEWLKHISFFEKNYADREFTTVYKSIGKPDFKKAEMLSDKEIEAELDRLLELLNQHNICLDVIGEYKDSVIYKFITEELFEEEIELHDVPGMFTHYTYEEFHPNPLLDARDAVEEIIKGLEDEKFEPKFYTWRFHENGIIDTSGQKIDADEIDKRYLLLRESIEAIKLNKLEQDKVEILSDEKAVYTGKIEYGYKMIGEKNWRKFNETLQLHLKPSQYAAMWGVTKMDFPGISL